MNVVSLFDGISCGQLALRKAGIPVTTYFASEVDKNAIKVTQHNFPDTMQLGDVTAIDGSMLHGADLLLGGSPCQGFSSAGLGLNFEDPRSALFFEYVRMRDEIGPKYFLLENVNMKEAHRDVISQFLGVEPIRINSMDFVPARRDRWYWTNIPIAPWVPLDRDWREIQETDKAAMDDCIVPRTPSREIMFFGEKCVNLGKRKIASALTTKMDRWSNAGLVPYGDGWCRFLTPRECERLQGVPDDYTSVVPKNARYHALGNGWTVDVIAHIFKGLRGAA